MSLRARHARRQHPHGEGHRGDRAARGDQSALEAARCGAEDVRGDRDALRHGGKTLSATQKPREFSTLLLDTGGATSIARITLNRPEKRNAVSFQLIADLL